LLDAVVSMRIISLSKSIVVSFLLSSSYYIYFMAAFSRQSSSVNALYYNWFLSLNLAKN